MCVCVCDDDGKGGRRGPQRPNLLRRRLPAVAVIIYLKYLLGIYLLTISIDLTLTTLYVSGATVAGDATK